MSPYEALQPDMEDDEDHQPDSIRHAVRQLSFAYQRGAAARRGEAPPQPPPVEALAAAHPAEPVDEVRQDALRRAEAVLFAAGEPLSADQVAASLPPGVSAPDVLMSLRKTYAGRGVQLVEVGGRWRFQTAQDLSFLFIEERHEQKKLSQAALETLAIIAYGQPVTRAEIEAVRGVAVSKGVIDQLMEAGWVRVKGRRKTPGRPVTLGTTPAFLEHFGLESLDLLPGKAELAAEGLLSDVLPEDFVAAHEAGEDEDVLGSGASDEGEAVGRAFVEDFIGDAEDDD